MSSHTYINLLMSPLFIYSIRYRRLQSDRFDHPVLRSVGQMSRSSINVFNFGIMPMSARLFGKRHLCECYRWGRVQWDYAMFGSMSSDCYLPGWYKWNQFFRMFMSVSSRMQLYWYKRKIPTWLIRYFVPIALQLYLYCLLIAYVVDSFRRVCSRILRYIQVTEPWDWCTTLCNRVYQSLA